MIPSFPKGASIDSIFLACHWLRQSVSLQRSGALFYGKHFFGNHNALAKHGNAFAERALGSTISGHELALEHSAWPVYSSLLPSSLIESCFTGLLTGTSPHKWHHFHGPHAATSYAREWRACHECCREDVGSAGCGVGHWRVVHQLPGVTFCPQHQNPLQYRCSACGAPLGGPWLTAMPGWPCLNCGSIKKEELRANRSTGAQALTTLYVKLLGGNGPCLSPLSRTELHEKVIGPNPTSRDIDVYLQRFLAAFDFAEWHELGDLLNAEVNSRGAVSAVLGGKASAAPLTIALAAFAFHCLDSHGSRMDASDFQENAGQQVMGEWEPPLDASDVAEICKRGSDFAIPSAAIHCWIRGASVVALTKQFSFSPTVFHQFLKLLPDHLRNISHSHLADASVEEVRDFHRSRIEATISSGSNGREELRARCEKSYLWCLRNDVRWLDENAPKRSRRTRSKGS